MTRSIYFGLFHLFLLLFCFCFEEYCGIDLNVKKLSLYESKISPIIRGLSFPYEERNFFPADFYKLSSPSNKLEESFSLINYKLINLFKVLMRPKLFGKSHTVKFKAPCQTFVRVKRNYPVNYIKKRFSFSDSNGFFKNKNSISSSLIV